MNVKYRAKTYTVLILVAVGSGLFIKYRAFYVIFLVLISITSLILAFDREYREYIKAKVPAWFMILLLLLVWIVVIIDAYLSIKT